ncbi:hypothetical protein SAMN05443245_7352 [Paraburkholderia fungorum]|uniref:Uncharacterized protein n=1 Tax=Paraburkholderia fungorum TaxID=134537 RepID=A0A1H1JVV4_9BURK|nr:DUF6723 family protein [Paraburkholderia fungorum]SDR54104.1 hypothetical protein SAMN05443245_7352 [Paraburkholderia fungorum]
MSRPKLLFAKAAIRRCKSVPATRSDYRMYVSYRANRSGSFLGELKVVRMTDDRLLFPFDGAPSIGPFATPAEAREAAVSKGEEIISLDLENPE